MAHESTSRSRFQLFTRSGRPSSLAFFVQGIHKTRLNVLRNGLRLHPFKNLDGPFGRVKHHPAIGAFGNMLFQLRPELRVNRFVEIIAELA